ncbi:hypothetical protein C5167_003319 [Papaver somniferum]|uniref:AB hydrolase-1 domain-containing protein n=1 Tax=Papaver somniferum TaxID=3469 RepID=A0A4Y7L386_PAPSO|nr:probable lysophospholipase BODYGUARD 4 [Papaver somniferum]XP_026413083.1 probable lysophospholipase BODYGUARD 4 [Papaver somniferum]XP_026413084.1 probable lysophospholipase BODYGUARD 4 [Papaver somniferum]XP_026413085.1 probable lysophospholipase BODYGUARD 4 [Papaver somniferum]XP_026413086.1 probable lysophospholipase BODYGUARD 4 [Papaver somniferum]XP_026413087.1 probable lysophospholipase BODYGUARD 4 [Papaver somniferum]RZC79102.1 hypothetical protein C5167_003319 [Papaver somniferum]
MLKTPSPFVVPIKLPRIFSKTLVSAISYIVFAFLDLLDIVLCLFYRFIDGVKEGSTHLCYCKNRGTQRKYVNGENEEYTELSETFYERKNIFRDMGFFKLTKENEEGLIKKEGSVMVKNRWSDCKCESCLSWQKFEDQNLHVAVKQPSPIENLESAENVILLHGFLSSSYLWTENVFLNLSKNGNQNCRLFAVDLLGFGKSPKPSDCFYTINDHLEMVEKSVIDQFQLDSFHLVAHSMGCIIALGIAAKYQKSVKSITLIAPPYFPSSTEQASLNALNRLAERKIWPPLLFGSSVMSWYEHVGRSICFIICRNHRTWEWLLKLVTRKRELSFLFMDLTRHTHHSAWHTMHNVICGGAKLIDRYLEAVTSSELMLTVIQGDKDEVVPSECIHNIKLKVPSAEIRIIPNANHNSPILDRKEDICKDLEHIWFSSAEKYEQKIL